VRDAGPSPSRQRVERGLRVGPGPDGETVQDRGEGAPPVPPPHRGQPLAIRHADLHQRLLGRQPGEPGQEHPDRRLGVRVLPVHLDRVREAAGEPPGCRERERTVEGRAGHPGLVEPLGAAEESDPGGDARQRLLDRAERGRSVRVRAQEAQGLVVAQEQARSRIRLRARATRSSRRVARSVGPKPCLVRSRSATCSAAPTGRSGPGSAFRNGGWAGDNRRPVPERFLLDTSFTCLYCFSDR
jgi:hypothetical protein